MLLTLSSSNSSVSVPRTVSIGPNQTSARFGASVASGAAHGTTLIRATAQNGATAATWFTINAAPAPERPVVTLAVAPSSIAAGASATLAWTLSGASSATIDNGIGTVTASGSRIVSPKASATYTIRAGTSSASATLSVKAAAAKPVVTLTVSPSSIAPGASATLAWSLSGVSSATIDNGIGTVTASGSRTVTPKASATYTIRAGTSSASATLSVKAPPAKPVVTLTVSPSSIAPGASATLAWTLSGVSSGTIDNGIGTVTASGSRTVTPKASATYTIRAGTSSASATLSVAALTSNYTIDFATYIGGNNWEHARDIAVDAAGNIYLAGGTESSNFRHTIGQNYAGSVDAFVMKMDPSGKLIWSTLLGGPHYDRAYGIEVDRSGNVYITGRAGRGFPVKNAFQGTFGGYNTGAAYGEENAFIAKLSSTGSVVWATYFGTADLNRDMDIDAAGNIYVVSNYQPSLGQHAFPPAWFAHAFQKFPQGGNDLVVAKIAGDGSKPLWATYLGGSGDDSHKASIRVANTGDLYIFTDTSSVNLPVPHGYQQTNHGGRDAYLAKMTGDGSGLLWATYFGGSGLEVCETHHLAVDASGNAYFAVTTQSSDAPVTAFDKSYNGTGTTFNHAVGDILVAKFSAAGQLVASTYVGGVDGEGPQGVAVDAKGNVYFSGGTISPNFPVSKGAVQANRMGGEDAFVVRLKADFSGIDYATYLGSSANDEGRTLFADAAGNIYVAIEADAGNFPNILRPLQAAFGGGSADILFVKLKPAP